VLVLVEVFFMAKAKEFPYEDSVDLKMRDVFVLPFRAKKFLLCMAFMFTWNYIANLNNGLWNYHLLNHLGFSYTSINFVGGGCQDAYLNAMAARACGLPVVLVVSRCHHLRR
jgi:hypothetical protein